MPKDKIPLKTSLDAWNGKPLLKIEGPFRPFRLSVTKAWALCQLMPIIEEFYLKNIHLTKLPGPRPSPPPSEEEQAILAKYTKSQNSPESDSVR